MNEAADFWEPETNDPAPDRVRKVSISLPESLNRRVRQRVGKGSMSRYVAEALEEKLRRDSLDAWLEEMEAKHGPIPQEVHDRVEEDLCALERKWAAEGF